jgi:hypothetical protein
MWIVGSLRLWAAIAASCASPRAELKGKVVDGTYTSPGAWFSVTLPQGANPFVKDFQIEDDSGRGEVEYDFAALSIPDFGEVFLLEVRPIPPAVLEKMAAESGAETLSNLANKALGDWRVDLAPAPAVVEDISFDSHLGPALLRIFRLEEGSLLQRASAGETRAFDTLVAVIAVKRGTTFVSLIAENDYQPLDQAGLAGRARSTFASLRLDPAPAASAR